MQRPSITQFYDLFSITPWIFEHVFYYEGNLLAGEISCSFMRQVVPTANRMWLWSVNKINITPPSSDLVFSWTGKVHRWMSSRSRLNHCCNWFAQTNNGLIYSFRCKSSRQVENNYNLSRSSRFSHSDTGQ